MAGQSSQVDLADGTRRATYEPETAQFESLARSSRVTAAGLSIDKNSANCDGGMTHPPARRGQRMGEDSPELMRGLCLQRLTGMQCAGSMRPKPESRVAAGEFWLPSGPRLRRWGVALAGEPAYRWQETRRLPR